MSCTRCAGDRSYISPLVVWNRAGGECIDCTGVAAATDLAGVCIVVIGNETWFSNWMDNRVKK